MSASSRTAAGAALLALVIAGFSLVAYVVAPVQAPVGHPQIVTPGNTTEPGGTPGATGPAGPAGPIGPQGPTGRNGTNGTNGANGTSAPSETYANLTPSFWVSSQESHQFGNTSWSCSALGRGIVACTVTLNNTGGPENFQGVSWNGSTTSWAYLGSNRSVGSTIPQPNGPYKFADWSVQLWFIVLADSGTLSPQIGITVQ